MRAGQLVVRTDVRRLLSVDGTYGTLHLRLVMSVHRCQAEIIFSLRVFRILTLNGPQSAAHAPSHSITSSAWTSKEAGTVRPRTLAVFMLITNSNLVGCSTGRSEGLVPLRILST